MILSAYSVPLPSVRKYYFRNYGKTNTTGTHPCLNPYVRPGTNFQDHFTEVKFTRQFIPSTSFETCPHIFVDASVKSYGAAAYISNQSQARLVMAKNRVAPLKVLTLPQLELMAALVGARLASHLLQTISTSNVTFWSDSQIVLYWLTTTKPLKCFVRNRVEEINQLKDRSPWRYCPTDDRLTYTWNISRSLTVNYGTPGLHGFPTQYNGLPGNITIERCRYHQKNRVIP